MKKIITLALLVTFSLSFSQYDYEASKEFPFGRPNPEAPKQITDYENMIGNCNCTSTTRNQDGTWAKPEAMEWSFKYILNGMAVQDQTLKADGAHSGSIRQFIADSSKWYVHWYSAKTPSIKLPTWEGTKQDNGNIVLYQEQKAPNGAEGFFRLTFYDISKSGYKWIGEWVDKEEKIVYPTWKIDCAKK